MIVLGLILVFFILIMFRVAVYTMAENYRQNKMGDVLAAAFASIAAKNTEALNAVNHDITANRPWYVKVDFFCKRYHV